MEATPNQSENGRSAMNATKIDREHLQAIAKEYLPRCAYCQRVATAQIVVCKIERPDESVALRPVHEVTL